MKPQWQGVASILINSWDHTRDFTPFQTLQTTWNITVPFTATQVSNHTSLYLFHFPCKASSIYIIQKGISLPHSYLPLFAFHKSNEHILLLLLVWCLLILLDPKTSCRQSAYFPPSSSPRLLSQLYTSFSYMLHILY